MNPPDVIAPAFILVRPQMGENIGGAARAMLNFGLDRMRVVEPRDGWPNPRAAALASGAGRVLDQAGVFASVQAAIADCDVVLATTARGRELTKPILSPEQAMAEVRGWATAGKRVGILFGPERAGLENEDLVHAQALITVPVNPEFPSLNLAQCVLLLGYEWRRGAGTGPGLVMQMAGTEFANALEIEKLGDHFEADLGEAGFFFPEKKAASMKLNLRNMWARLGLTRAEVQTLHGMLRQIAYKKRSDGR